MADQNHGLTGGNQVAGGGLARLGKGRSGAAIGTADLLVADAKKLGSVAAVKRQSIFADSIIA